MVMQSLRRCLHQLNMCSAWLNCVFYASNSTFDLIFKTYCCRLSCITMTDWCLDRLKCGSSRIPKNMALVRNSKSNMAFVRNNQRGLFMTSPNIYIGHKSPKVMIHCISQIIYMVIIQIIRIKKPLTNVKKYFFSRQEEIPPDYIWVFARGDRSKGWHQGSYCNSELQKNLEMQFEW